VAKVKRSNRDFKKTKKKTFNNTLELCYNKNIIVKIKFDVHNNAYQGYINP